MPSIEWYDNGIFALKKLIREQEIELERFCNKIDGQIKEQKNKMELEEATGEDKMKVKAKEVRDIAICIDQYKFYSKTNFGYNRLGYIRSDLINDLKKRKRKIKREKEKEFKTESSRLRVLIAKRESLNKLELEGVEIPVLNINQIESEIEQQIKPEKLGEVGTKDVTKISSSLVSSLQNYLKAFLIGVEKPEFIANLSSSIREDQLIEIIDLLFHIIDKFEGFICPECRSIMSLKEKIEICEICGHDSKKIYP